MTLPQIDALKVESWSESPQILSRLGALQSLENQLAVQENRPIVPIGVIPNEKRTIEPDGQPLLKGYFDAKDGENDSISIDPALLYNDEPYQAVGTYFHEARHAYQYHVANHPDEHPEVGKEQADLWNLNNQAYIGEEDIYYSGGELKFGHYYGQPVELDAREIGRQRTEELYSGQFKDQGRYERYRKTEQQLNDQLDLKSKIEVGQDYELEAQKAVEMKYEAQQEIISGQSGDNIEDLTQGADHAGKTTGISSELSSDPLEVPVSKDKSNEETYGYGYGY